ALDPDLGAPVPDLRALDRYIAEAREAWEVPGLAVAIVKGDEVVFARGYGVRDLRTGGEVDEHTLFAIASNTKAFTAAALAILVDEGELSWDDRVREHLPWFRLYDPYVTEDLRIRDLLSHRSGLGTFSGDLLWYGTHYDAEEVVRRARHVPQANPFRGGYGYSNLMFIAAGEVVRAVSGEPWDAFVRRRILEPLGMERTVLSTDSLVSRANVATPHGPWEGEVVAFPWYNWDAMGAAGGIISSVAEMAEWLELQLDRGVLAPGDTLFSPRRSWEMWTVHTPLAVSPGYQELYPTTHFRGYGLGWSLNDYKGRKVVSHGGGYDGMFSRVVLVPEEELGAVVLTNSMTGVTTAITNRVLDLYLGGDQRDWSELLRERAERADAREAARRAEVVERTIEGTDPSLPLDAYTGTYGGAMYGEAEVTREDGGLVLRLLPNPDLVADLEHLQLDTWVIEWRRPFPWFGKGVAQFLTNPAGEVVELKLDVPNQDLWFHELELIRRDG
ncbi:MAG: serine hydrolase, partial [Gemmatimonadota bacterium]